MASSSALKHWCVVDKVWPQDAAAHKNYKFLEGLGCVRETGDIFSSTLGIERCNEYSGKGVFVASNLNWRQSNREVANKAGFFDHSFGAYYELLLPVLRAKASFAHIVILARLDDGVHDHLLRSGWKVLIQPLRTTHTAMQSVPGLDPQAPIQDIGHGGGQIAIVSICAGLCLSQGCIFSEGFDLDVLLQCVAGFVCFLGEGDCRLAVQCAKKFLLKEVEGGGRIDVGCAESDSHRSHPYRIVSPVAARTTSFHAPQNAPLFTSYTALIEAMKASKSPQLWTHEDCFFGACCWNLFQHSDSKSLCLRCRRVAAPESTTLDCCRTCARTRGLSHGAVCDARAAALRV